MVRESLLTGFTVLLGMCVLDAAREAQLPSWVALVSAGLGGAAFRSGLATLLGEKR